MGSASELGFGEPIPSRVRPGRTGFRLRNRGAVPFGRLRTANA